MAIEDALRNLTSAQRQAALEGPALTPPPGVLPNFVDPPNRNELGYGLLFSCAAICAVVVGIRLYAKLFRRKKVDMEDCKTSVQIYGPIIDCTRSGYRSGRGTCWLSIHLVQNPAHAWPVCSSMERTTEEPCHYPFRTFHPISLI